MISQKECVEYRAMALEAKRIFRRNSNGCNVFAVDLFTELAGASKVP
jgi:hypothetical protein